VTTPDPLPPVIVNPADQCAVWFLGVLTKIRIDGAATGGALSVLEHREERGHATPLHRHDIADETFLMIDGTLRVEVDGEIYSAGSGAMAFLPRNRSHRFIVTSPTAHFLTLHTPAGFDDFAVTAGKPAVPGENPPTAGPNPAELAKLAATYGIEILGPPLSL
jgi:quercetin dioxygenase-like cupin family protein